MTDCPNGEVRDLLPDLLNGRLSPDVRREVEAHVRSCADCRAELALLRDLRATMARVPVMDAARIAAAVPAHRAPARRLWAGWRAAAAILVIAAGGTSVALIRYGLDSGPDTVLAVAHPPTAAPTVVSSAPSTPLTPTVLATTPGAHVRPVAARELEVASSTTSDLSDRELKALLKDIESLDAVPSTDVENAALISPVSPRGSSE
jgi:anti-sigma factor RsiW